MMPSQFGPLVTAMVTPFKPDGEVDYARAEELAARLVADASSALVVCGTTGESPTLTPTEKLELFRRVKRAVGHQVPIIANTGDNETAFSMELSKRAQEVGVDALLLVVPYYNRPSQEGLYQHFKAIAQNVALPCLLYNVPSRTSRNLDAETTVRLSAVPNIVGIKEAGGDMTQVGHIRRGAGPDFMIYSGNDADTLPMLTLGCCGVISVVSHLAGKFYRQMLESFWCKDFEAAREMHLRLLPVIEAIFPATSPSPAGVKAGLVMQGFDCGSLRLPLVQAEEKDRCRIEQALREAGLL